MEIGFDDLRGIAGTILGGVAGAGGGIGLFKLWLDQREKAADRSERKAAHADEMEQRIIERLSLDLQAQKQEMQEMDTRCDERLKAQDVKIIALENRLDDCQRQHWEDERRIVELERKGRWDHVTERREPEEDP